MVQNPVGAKPKSLFCARPGGFRPPSASAASLFQASPGGFSQGKPIEEVKLAPSKSTQAFKTLIDIEQYQKQMSQL